ncbi:MAG: cytotoxic translational repressor of toxin-antitoxin stability system [Nanoarchaeota archaeon]|nr:cytotoxic translational repressor of toxin-antitoxin stability system [Nanoarchaeota archaeon]
MYEIDINNRAYKFIISLQNSQEILLKIKLLKYFKSQRKLDLDVKKLKGQKKNLILYRIRVGTIRIIFQIFEDKKIIYIRAVDYRGNIYE